MTDQAPLPDPAKEFKEQDPRVLLAMCIWGEARGESWPGKISVGHVVMNRTMKRGFGVDITQPLDETKVVQAVLHPYAFSCLNANDPNRVKLLNPTQHEKTETWEQCYKAACAVIDGTHEDPTDGAVFYHDASLPGAPKAWGSVQKTASIGRLHFYK
jgi:spore germination cell wall hydrolase CwlJ-like protein